MDADATTVVDIRKFIEEHLDKTNKRYDIQKQITETDIDNYILNNPYFQPETAYALVQRQCDDVVDEKFNGFIEEIYYSISIWIE